MSEGNIHEIYLLLLQDKKLELPFRSERECKNFRTRLAKFKSAQDKIYGSLDLLEERQTLRCEVQASLNPADPSFGPPFSGRFWLEAKEPAPHWEFKIVEERVEERSGELGKATETETTNSTRLLGNSDAKIEVEEEKNATLI